MAEDDRVSLDSFEEARSVVDDEEVGTADGVEAAPMPSRLDAHVAAPDPCLRTETAAVSAVGGAGKSPLAHVDESLPAEPQIAPATRAGDADWVAGAGEDGLHSGDAASNGESASDDDALHDGADFGDGSEEEDEFFTRGRRAAHGGAGGAPASAADSAASAAAVGRSTGKGKITSSAASAAAAAAPGDGPESDAGSLPSGAGLQVGGAMPAASAAEDDALYDVSRAHGDDHDDGGDDGDDDDGYYGDGGEAGDGSAAVGGAGAGPATDDEARGAAADEDAGRFLPDLVLPDGRILSRRPLARTEADDTADEKKDVAMAGAMKDEGNRHFTAGEHETAAACYTEALRAVPRAPEFDEHRAVYYGNRAACHLAMNRLEDALYDCDRSLECNPRYAKVVGRRAAVLEKLGKLDEAAADAEIWAQMDTSSAPRQLVARLKKAITERDEKLKEEMMGKLKDMGNWVLGKFGLSIDNFKAVQDPKTGSYSISFQQ